MIGKGLEKEATRKWTFLDGKEQSVLENFDIKTVMEAIGLNNAEGIDKLWSVICLK